ncbi:hypothetical protein GNP92_04995 [Paenibacillus timonensis]|nr:hypothetical protein [Paenibacillus timonensis]MUG85708.1 hypothetical protein [Paenibacillus timonensis]
MEEFRKKLNEASVALIQLSAEFQRIEAKHSDLLSEGYPFSVCLLEVVNGMLQWRDTINHMEVIERDGEKTDI